MHDRTYQIDEFAKNVPLYSKMMKMLCYEPIVLLCLLKHVITHAVPIDKNKK
jgi:hypothetical protein